MADAAELPSMVGHVAGRIVGTSDGQPLVTFAGNPGGPIPARSALSLPWQGTASFAQPIGALLVFERERADLPIVVGLLEGQALARPTAAAKALEARVDGKRVCIEAEDEIELRCGKASIILRKNGRLVIRGAYVETRAEGVNRIKGGSVQIN